MTSAPTRGTRRTIHPVQAGRWPFPARSLHLVDIENLAGTGLPAERQVADLRQAYTARVGIGAMDQVVIGCNHKALPATGHGWPGARYLVRSGPDGADTELLTVIAVENIAARFTHVTIASGDGIFSWAAASLATAGCQVTVVSRMAALARTLYLAAPRIVYLDTPVTALTVAAPALRDAA